MRIIVLDDYQGVASTYADWGALEAEIDFELRHVADPAELVPLLQPYDVVVAMRERTPLPAEVIEALPNLRLIVTTGRRNPSIDVAAARACGIEVCGTRGLSTAPAELTWALILGLARHLVTEASTVSGGGWQTTIGRDLAGKVLGVIGLGRIGAQVAAVGKAFGMEVVAWSQNLTPERAAEHGCTAVSLDELLAGSHVVTLHLALSERTRGVLGERELGRMRPDALLVNTARSGLLDTAALVKALHAGQLAGAGLDVYDAEPIPLGDPLLHAPRTLLTPHLGYVTDDVYRLFFGDVVEDIAAFIAGAPLRVL